MRKHYYRRGELIYRILAAVAKGALVTGAIIIALSGTGFYRRKRPMRLDPQKEKEREDNHRFYATLSRLRKDGLLIKKGKSWKITLEGRKHLAYMEEHSTVLRVKEYPKVKLRGMKIIVAFDIPERLRSKREALRAALQLLGFTMLQKSLWIGECKIPEEFMDDLKEWRIVEHVHVFEVAKRGTIAIGSS